MLRGELFKTCTVSPRLPKVVRNRTVGGNGATLSFSRVKLDVVYALLMPYRVQMLLRSGKSREGAGFVSAGAKANFDKFLD